MPLMTLFDRLKVLYWPGHRVAGRSGVILRLLCLTAGSCDFPASERALVIGFSQHTNTDTCRRTMLETTNREVSFNPVLDISSKEFRDPSVFRYEPQHKWVMATVMATEHRMALYSCSSLVIL